MAGLTVVLLGCLTMSTLTQETTPLGIMLRLAPIGIGFGLFQSPNNSAIMGTAPRERLGIASGLLSLSRTLGQSTGLPLMGVVFSAFAVRASSGGLPAGADITNASPAALTSAIHGTYLVGAGVISLALLLAIIAYRFNKRREQENNLK
jgi:fucose permease